jgi:MinD-like ATPase involved in chromosome partitioning or flagellar assembly
MALANIAWILASMGKKVLVMDWDLESPGLHRYFHPFLSDEDLRSHEGILDLIVKYADATLQSNGSVDRLSELAQAQSCAVSLEWDFPSGGILDFVSAGRQDESYSIRVSTFDWDSFWSHLDGGSFLDALARDVRSNYDFVLIDSRTGLSDTAGICIFQLPDIVVCCFSMNRQSIDGSVAVVRASHTLLTHLAPRPLTRPRLERPTRGRHGMLDAVT